MSFPLGEVASLGAAAGWAVGLTLYRRDARDIGARAVNLFKGAFATLLFLICLPIAGFRYASLEAQGFLMLSGLVGLALGDTLLFLALAHLGAHRAALFGTLGPALTAAGGWLFLGETLTASQLLGIVLAAAGVGMVVYFRGGTEPAHRATARGVLFGVLSAACQAGGVLLAKRGLHEMDALAGTTLRVAAATALLAVVALLRRDLMPDLRRLIKPGPLGRLLPAAFCGTFLALWLMQTGIKYTESAVANALHSTTPLFTLPIALVFLRERFGALAIFGSFVAVAGVVVLLIYAPA
ncbi:MAG: DMT family transporter [Planctomycetota bacterium]